MILGGRASGPCVPRQSLGTRQTGASALRLILSENLGLKSFLLDDLTNLIDCYFPRIEADFQSVFFPVVGYPLNTLKPYQGFFDPIGSVASQQFQSDGHVFDMKGNIRDCVR